MATQADASCLDTSDGLVSQLGCAGALFGPQRLPHPDANAGIQRAPDELLAVCKKAPLSFSLNQRFGVRVAPSSHAVGQNDPAVAGDELSPLLDRDRHTSGGFATYVATPTKSRYATCANHSPLSSESLIALSCQKQAISRLRCQGL